MALNKLKKINTNVIVTPSMTGSTVDTQTHILHTLLGNPQNQTGTVGKYSQKGK